MESKTTIRRELNASSSVTSISISALGRLRMESKSFSRSIKAFRDLILVMD